MLRPQSQNDECLKNDFLGVGLNKLKEKLFQLKHEVRENL
jgi:hypothetical protein